MGGPEDWGRGPSVMVWAGPRPVGGTLLWEGGDLEVGLSQWAGSWLWAGLVVGAYGLGEGPRAVVGALGGSCEQVEAGPGCGWGPVVGGSFYKGGVLGQWWDCGQGIG